jgi:uncharacterized protein (TIGR03083 family)
MPDLPEAIDAFEHTARALLQLGRECSEADFERPTPCPGWTVRDQFSHVVGIERWMLGLPEPEHEVPPLPHVRTRFGRRVEVAVDLRRGVPGPEVVAELADVLRARLTALRARDVAADDMVLNPLGGSAPLLFVLAVRTFDVWTHEQDVRAALGRPGNLGSPAAVVAVDRLRQALPRVVARDASAPIGASVAFDVGDPVPFTDVVMVEEGEDGRAVGQVVEPGAVGEASVRLSLGSEAFCRRATGRIGVEDIQVSVDGDEDLGRRVLDALAVTP